MLKKDDQERAEYKIPVFMWLLLVAAAFAIGMLLQKNQMLEGKNGILGILPGGATVAPTNVAQQQAQQPTFKPFDYKKELGTYAPKGDKNAPVKLVVFSDFECPYCAALEGDNQQVMDSLKTRISGWEPAMPNIVKNYVDTGKAVIYFRDFTAHQDSTVMHNAARCANEQGKFWEMHDALFALQDEGGVGGDAKAKMQELAENIGLDSDKFNSCLDSNKYQKQINEDMQAAQIYGVQGTPHVFINDKYVSGADGYATFKQIIDEELKK